MSPPSFEEIVNLQLELHQLRHQYWIQHDLFSFQWWILLFTFILPWILWYKVIPKEKKAEILVFGLLVGILASQLDELGINNGKWAYPFQLTQASRGLNPYNFSFIPVGYMLVYYYFPKWNHFIIANIFLAIIAAFGVEPLLKWLQIYKTLEWSSFYSFPIYILIPIVFRIIVYYFLEKHKT